MDIDSFLKKRHQVFAKEMSVQKNVRRELRMSGSVIFFIFCLAVVVGMFVVRPPRNFPIDHVVSIESGSSLREIAEVLEDAAVVRSSQIFQLAAKVSGNAESMQAGDYAFERRLSVLAVARRLAKGDYGNSMVRITIPEGSSLEDIGNIAARVLKDFNVDYFIDEAIEYNGYLFPETYMVFPSTTEDELIEIMHDEFSEQLADIVPDRILELDPEELRDAVIMASIIEREALGEDDAYLISGILWKRIDIDMPLQVDASFAYLFDKASSEVTVSDLEYDSPYNTYVNKGLPPGPLGNPGAVALDAAFHPADSPYLYYLHDSSGQVHFGRNFDEHRANKRAYLD